MCCEADWWVPSSKYGLPLTAAGDSCRTSRLALTSIARVRPAVFITSISKEIARYNNLGNFTIFYDIDQYWSFYNIAISRVLFKIYSCCASILHLALTTIGQVRPAIFISKKITLLFKDIWLLKTIVCSSVPARRSSYIPTRRFVQLKYEKNNSCFVEWYGN